MKKTFLILIAFFTGLVTIGQPATNNVDLGAFVNGTNGSNGGSGANIELALRIKPGGAAYTAVPAAEDFVMYFFVPKTDFALTDVVNIVQANTSIYGATGTMSFQGLADIGDPLYYYFGIVLNNAGGMNLSSLNGVTNAWSFAYTVNFTPVKTPAQYNKLKIVDQTNNAFLSSVFGAPTFTTLQMSTANQLTAQALITLPVSLLNFSGYKSGTKNVLNWTTASEQNNKGFEVQRAIDGTNYSSLGFVNSAAPGGFTSLQINYTFDDNNPASPKQYYRLKQIDLDGRSKLSNIVMITGGRPAILGIGGLFPNPARTVVNVIIDAPQRDDITVLVTDMAGKTVKQQLANVDIGSNTVPVDIANLASGSYLVKLLCKSSDCAIAAGKFNKQ